MAKKDDTPLCPFDKKACIKERCMGWQTGPVERTIDGVKQPGSLSDCFIIWNIIFLKGIANRTDGTQVSVESMRNEIIKRMDTPLRELAGPGNGPRLGLVE